MTYIVVDKELFGSVGPRSRLLTDQGDVVSGVNVTGGLDELLTCLQGEDGMTVSTSCFVSNSQLKIGLPKVFVLFASKWR